MKGVLYSVFDPAFPQSSFLYTSLAKEVGSRTSNVVFVGNPFQALPHPMLAPAGNRELQLRALWDQLALFLKLEVKAHLDRGSLVFLDGCGLNAFLSAACLADAEECVRLEKLHLSLEHRHLRRLHLPRPTYILQRTDQKLEISHTRNIHPALEACGVRRFENCSKRIHVLLHAYFAKHSKQHLPYWIPLVQRTRTELSELWTKFLDMRMPLAA